MGPDTRRNPRPKGLLDSSDAKWWVELVSVLVRIVLDLLQEAVAEFPQLDALIGGDLLLGATFFSVKVWIGSFAEVGTMPESKTRIPLILSRASMASCLPPSLLRTSLPGTPGCSGVRR